MSRTKIALGITLLVFGLLLIPVSRGSLVTQVVESDGHRTTEYGILGTSFPLRSERLPSVLVRDDVISHILAVAPLPPGGKIADSNMTMRIRRHSNTEWFAQIFVPGKASDVVSYYKKRLKPSLHPSRPGSNELSGVTMEGSEFWLYESSPPAAGSKGSTFSIKITKQVRGL